MIRQPPTSQILPGRWKTTQLIDRLVQPVAVMAGRATASVLARSVVIRSDRALRMRKTKPTSQWVKWEGIWSFVQRNAFAINHEWWMGRAELGDFRWLASGSIQNLSKRSQSCTKYAKFADCQGDPACEELGKRSQTCEEYAEFAVCGDGDVSRHLHGGKCGNEASGSLSTLGYLFVLRRMCRLCKLSSRLATATPGDHKESKRSQRYFGSNENFSPINLFSVIRLIVSECWSSGRCMHATIAMLTLPG